jgi:hypothetical protein
MDVNTNKVVDMDENNEGNTITMGNNKISTDENSTKENTNVESWINSIFTTSNFILLLWFLGIYIIAYFILGFLLKRNDYTNNQYGMSRTIDIIILGAVILFSITSFYSMNDEQKEHIFGNSLNKLNQFLNEPSSILTVSSFILIFYVTIYLFRFPMTADTKPISIALIESVAWILFIMIAIVDFFKYVLYIPLIDIITNLYNTNTPTIEIKEVNREQKPTVDDQTKEVFNISNNLYTYDDAQAVCSAYGAELATYDQIEQAYNDGAEWCNYGWSDNQMIFFPTQKSTWDKLQKSKEHKNDCGRPGVNGGYIANPYLKFGINCYGKKPKATEDDLARMQSIQDYVVPKSQQDVELDKKVKYWKDNADKLLKINSFNSNSWFQRWTGGNTIATSGNTVSIGGNTVTK